MNQTNSRSTLQSRPRQYSNIYLFFPIHTMIGWNQRNMSIGQISTKFWPLHRTFYSTKDGSTQIMNRTNSRSTLQPRPRQYSNIYLFFLIHTMIGWNQRNMSIGRIPTKFWPLHRTFYSTKDGSTQIMNQTNSRSTLQPRPRQYSNIYLFFLINIMIGWNQRNMSIGQISTKCWPLHRTFYSTKDGSTQIMNRTNSHRTPTKTQTVL
jgi:hypothetical protein